MGSVYAVWQGLSSFPSIFLSRFVRPGGGGGVVYWARNAKPVAQGKELPMTTQPNRRSLIARPALMSPSSP